MNIDRRWTSILLCLLAIGCVNAQETAPGVRLPAVAGQFYPASAPRLKLAIQQFMKDAQPVMPEKPVALVVPHAGYIYSGQIAADAFRQAAAHAFDVVVILGTNHTVPGFRAISILPRGAYRTPLGDAPIDDVVVSELLAAEKACTTDPASHEKEHSVEVQVPFVQVLFPRAKIVPVVIGQPDAQLCSRFGRVLANTLRKRRALIVASSDLSHYPSYHDAVAADRATLESLAKLDAAGFIAAVRSRISLQIPDLVTCACGEAPILAAIAAARELGARRGRVISYANSGDVLIGDRSRVVGYGAVAFLNGDGKPDLAALRKSPELSRESALQPADKQVLLTLARDTIRRYLSTGTLPLVRGYDPSLARKRGAFVTLKKGGRLRGCIGRLSEDLPLAQTVAAMAAQAAFNDRRFSPLAMEEFTEIEIEISVLTTAKPVKGFEDIQTGRDGVILQKEGRSSVFLPQVAVEYRWGRPELLDNLCRKAGLSSGCWKQGATFRTFQAEVFGESGFE